MKVIIVESNKEKATVMYLSLCKKKLQQLLTTFASEDNPDVESQAVSPRQEYADYVFIRRDSSHKKVMVRDIVYLEADRNYCNIHLANNACMNVCLPMSEVIEYLPPNYFKRVHRSFTVNMEYVDIYMGNMVILSNKQKIDISREYRSVIEKEFVCIGSRKRVREKKTE